MAILELQRRLQEVGRIRIGQQVETKGGKKRPASLGTFRLTSPDRSRIDAAAKLYGGDVKEWANNGRQEWEVVTDADRLPVVVPPGAMAFSQWFELWSAGGCQRRCDGVTEQLSEQPCICKSADNEECQPHTRLSLLLTDVPGLGLWRLDTQGWHAARELAAAVETITIAAGKGLMLPATLRLEQRSTKRLDEGTHRFVVPTLDVEATAGQLIRGELQQKEVRAALTPVPEPEGKPLSIAEQVSSAKAIESRKRTESMRATGVKPRTAREARPGVARGDPTPNAGSPPPDEPPPDEPTQAVLPEPPTSEQIMQTVRETTAMVNNINEVKEQQMATDEQLRELLELLRAQGLDTRDAMIAWCSAAVGRPISGPRDLSADDFTTCKQILADDDNDQLAKINAFYAAVSKAEMLADLTQFLQRDTPLKELDELTDEDRKIILEAFAMRNG